MKPLIAGAVVVAAAFLLPACAPTGAEPGGGTVTTTVTATVTATATATVTATPARFPKNEQELRECAELWVKALEYYGGPFTEAQRRKETLLARSRCQLEGYP